jgi:hypothetical protein
MRRTIGTLLSIAYCSNSNIKSCSWSLFKFKK